MCGLTGYLVSSHERQLDILQRMNAEIKHRGPDDEGFFEGVTRNQQYSIGLAHRRLSIIDLSGGHQPIASDDGAIQLVFNGEIYNFLALRSELLSKGHVFRTHSDTETILVAYQEWGVECVSKFRGMFVFTLWDANSERLVLVRDHFGKKPLFIYQAAGVFLFASEIKSILAYPGIRAQVNKETLSDYFAYRYVPGPDTLFTGIHKLMPGCVGVWENGQFKVTRYYSPPDRQAYRPTVSLADPVGSFLEKLDESVSLRMMSDVPFGAFLSGGIDSSAVVGLMSRRSNLPVKTFSVGFDEEEYSELRYAKSIADQFGADHHELVVSQDSLIDYLPSLVRFRDAPVSEPSDIPIYLLAKEASRTVKMVLTGEGSDEVLGGYPKHVYERYARAYQLLPGFFRHGLIEPLVGAMPYRFRRAKTAVVNLGLERFEERMPRWFGALSESEKRQLLSVFRDSSSPVSTPRQFDCDEDNSWLRRILYFDQTSWLPDNLLERGDRMTMAASIEARMPFMDYELAEFVSSLPDDWRVKGHTTKRILREAMKRLLPAQILERPKVGFRVPVNEWFQGPMRDYLYEHLTGNTSITRDYYRKSALDQVLKEHAGGRHNHEKLLWTMLNLEIWHREYKVSA